MSNETGVVLERRLNYFFWKAGYFVRRNIQMTLERGLHISDIDVYAIRFDEFLRPLKLAIECKHTEGGFDSILKLRGIADYYEIDVPIIVRKKINLKIHNFVSDLGMLAITHTHLEELESTSEELKNEYLSIGYHSQRTTPTLNLYIKKLNKNRETKNLLWELNETWMIKNPFRKIGLFIDIYKKVNNLLLTEEKKDPMPLIWLAYENFILSVLTCIEMSAQLLDRPKYHRKNVLLTEILGGNFSQKEKKELVDILKEILKVVKIPIGDNILNLEPYYLRDLNLFIDKLIKNRTFCQKYLRFIDLITYGFIIYNEKIDLGIVKKELNITNKQVKMFAEWNRMMLKVLDKENKIPEYFNQIL